MAEETIKKVKVTLERKKGGPPMGYGRSKRKVGDNVYELGIGKITVNFLSHKWGKRSHKYRKVFKNTEKCCSSGDGKRI